MEMDTMVRIGERTMPISIIAHALDGLENIINYMNEDDTFDKNELHHRLFNEDYFIIGYYEAKQWLKRYDLDAFDVIDEVQEYEKSQFGETNTKINSESMVNMFAYIKGEELLWEAFDNVDMDDNATLKQMKALATYLDEKLSEN
jgi:hypothetical protein